VGGAKGRLSRLVDRRPASIVMNDRTDARRELVFEHACRMGLEGIVSKRLSAAYHSGPSRHWLKIKNPDSPAMVRARDHFARLRE
jgi:bifunctional non-homologous end joining protein LigD